MRSFSSQEDEQLPKSIALTGNCPDCELLLHYVRQNELQLRATTSLDARNAEGKVKNHVLPTSSEERPPLDIAEVSIERVFWNLYQSSSFDGIIYVLDGADRACLEQSIADFHTLISVLDARLSFAPVLIFANKELFSTKVDEEFLKDAVSVDGPNRLSWRDWTVNLFDLSKVEEMSSGLEWLSTHLMVEASSAESRNRLLFCGL